MFADIREALLAGKEKEVGDLVEQALASGQSAARILNEGLIAAMERLGLMFKNNEVFIPEVLVAARAMNEGLNRLEPRLVRDKVEPRGVVVIGTVKGDLHDIGKNLVAMMLRGSGYKIVDLGIDVAPETFLEAARGHGTCVVALSALLTTTMIHMKNVVETLRTSGLNIPVIIGGAPVTRAYADRIGVEGYASDAAGAVEEIGRLLAESGLKTEKKGI